MIPLPLLAFLKANWEPIAIAAIIGGVVLSFHHIKAQRDDAVNALAVINATMAKQIIDNKIAQDRATKDQTDSETTAHKQIEDLNIDKTTLTNAIKGYYNAPNNPKSSMVHGTGIVLPPVTSGGTAEVASSTEGLVQGESECGPAIAGLQTKIEVLENGLAEETIEFNSARARVDRDCAQIGCLE
jgi:hypothetical protein